MQKKNPKKPNIIIILADDMGYSDIGCYGGEIETPNLDWLAENGLRFSQFYNTPKCSPSRASLLTGLHPHQVGMGILANQDMDKVPEPPDGYVGDLSTNCVTIAEILKQNGYATFISGKWHLSNNTSYEDDTWPRKRGFDHHYGNLNGATSYFYPATMFRDGENVDEEAVLNPDFYYTDSIADQACQYLNEHIQKIGKDNVEGNPFFLYLPFTCPHWPLHAKEEDIQKYKGKFDEGWDVLREQRMKNLIEMGILKEKWDLSEREFVLPSWEEIVEDAEENENENEKNWLLKRMEVYAAQIDCMDQAIGRILNLLKKNNIIDDTFIIFLSDNGACAEEIGDQANFWIPKGVSRANTRDGKPIKHGCNEEIMPGPEDTWQSVGRIWANLSNTPFRGYKSLCHEGGIATPLILHYPNFIKEKGGIRHQKGQLTDIMPTILDLCEIQYPKTFEGRKILPCQGKSMAEYFNQSTFKDKKEYLYWEHQGNAAIRKGDWKLVKLYKNPWELYDMEKDRTETINIVNNHGKIVHELEDKYSWWEELCNVLPYEEVTKIKYNITHPNKKN